MVHEIGHSLGLRHSVGNKRSMMFPSYRPDLPVRLDKEDIQRIQQLYGVRQKNQPKTEAPDREEEEDDRCSMFFGPRFCRNMFEQRRRIREQFMRPVWDEDVKLPSIENDGRTIVKKTVKNENGRREITIEITRWGS